ncbi:MAG: polyketide cyclase [Cytophaga sp.]|nr:polyketide cyclase [Cytophaga sp.]
MTILITILLVLAGLIALVLLVALFTRKAYGISRSIVIAKPRHEVFDYIRYLKNQKEYSKWVMTDPAKKEEFRGTDGQVGFVYYWNGNQKAGEGEQEITALKEHERIDIEVRFIRPFAGLATTPFVLETAGDHQTRVTWGMNSAMKYPMNIMLLIVNIEKMLGADLDISLSNLKRILETGK